MPKANYDWLLRSARSTTTSVKRSLTNQELHAAAIQLYKQGNGTFSSDAAAINFIIYSKPSEVANLIFTEAASVGKPIRNFIELLPAGAVNAEPGRSQCGKGAQYNPVDLTFAEGKTFCWLCGCPISGANAKNNPECEHIIPALRATMTVGMFSTAQIMKKIREKMETGDFGSVQWKNWNGATADNYLWAHSACNQSSGKGAMVLLGYDEVKNVFNFNDVNGSALQEKIYNIIGHGIIKPIPKQCRGQRSCYQRNDGKKRMYGNCTTADGSQWDPQQKGCTSVSSPYEAYDWEMKRAADQVNHVWKEFGGNIRAFAEYCLMQTKLYLSAEGLKLAMSEKERLESVLSAQQAAADALTAYQNECAKVIALIAAQIEIVQKLHALSAETLLVTAADDSLHQYVFSDDLLLAKTRFRQQIQKLFTVYCRDSSMVVQKAAFVNDIMLKFFTNTETVAGGGTVVGNYRPEVQEMLNLILQAGNNAPALLITYINCVVVFNIYQQKGWENVANLPHPTASTEKLAAILYPYPKDDSKTALIQSQNNLRKAFVAKHGGLTEPSQGRSSGSGAGAFEKLMNNLFQVDTNFVLPAFGNQRECERYLIHQFTILVGMIMNNVPVVGNDGFAGYFQPVINKQGELQTQITANSNNIAEASQQQVAEILSRTPEEQTVHLLDQSVMLIVRNVINSNPITKTLLIQAPGLGELLGNTDLFQTIATIVGCNLMQRLLRAAPTQELGKFLTVGQNRFCGQLGIDAVNIEARSLPSAHLQGEESPSAPGGQPGRGPCAAECMYQKLGNFYTRHGLSQQDAHTKASKIVQGEHGPNYCGIVATTPEQAASMHVELGWSEFPCIHEDKLKSIALDRKLAKKYLGENLQNGCGGQCGGKRRKKTRKRKRRKYRTIKKKRRRKKVKSLKRRRRRRRKTRGK